MTIAVTGASGFIGRHLVGALETSGAGVLRIAHTEIADPRKLAGFLSSHDVHALVHLAWSVLRGPKQMEEQEACVRMNDNLLAAARESFLQRIVVLGTADEFGSRSGVVGPDDAAQGSLSPYGAAKTQAREACRKWAGDTGRTVAWLRPFSVYGPGQQGSMAIPYAIACARERRDAEFSDGLQKRDFIHVSDVVASILSGLKVSLQGFHAFNVGTGEGTALRAVLEAIADHFGARDCFHFGAKPRRPDEPDELVADIADTRRLLAWSPAVAWRQGIEQTCRAAAG